VKGIFNELNEGDGEPRIDASRAVEIGEIDDHAAYAAPTEDGGFCFYFAPNPRSGPSGTACILDAVEPNEIVLAPQLGHDGGFVFGRVGAQSAETVEIELSGGGGTLTSPIGADGFFLVEIPQDIMALLMDGGAFDERRVQSLSATAKDASGKTVARSASSFEQSLRRMAPDMQIEPTPEG
jgi:hypothetical protein